jgi:hypothetical protein
MPALLGDLAPKLIAESASPEAATSKVLAISMSEIAALRRSVFERTDEFGYDRAAVRLKNLYRNI